MPARYCSFCNKLLHNFEHYFCSSCGKRLPDELVLPVKIVRKEKTVEVPKSKGKINLEILKKRKILGPALLLIGLVPIVLMFVNIVPKIPGLFDTSSAIQKEDIDEEKITEQNLEKVLESNRNYNSAVFGTQGFAQMVPFEADLYFEAHDFSWLFMNTSFFNDELKEFVNTYPAQQYCIFALQDDDDILWVLMASVEDTSSLGELISLIPSNYWDYRIVADKVVFAGKEKVFDMIESSTEGLTKNFSMNPFYARAVSTTPKEGQALIIMSGYKGKKILESVTGMNNWMELNPLVGRILDLGYNEIVVRQFL